jgi:hypothetical protein
MVEVSKAKSKFISNLTLQILPKGVIEARSCGGWSNRRSVLPAELRPLATGER